MFHFIVESNSSVPFYCHWESAFKWFVSWTTINCKCQVHYISLEYCTVHSVYFQSFGSLDFLPQGKKNARIKWIFWIPNLLWPKWENTSEFFWQKLLLKSSKLCKALILLYCDQSVVISWWKTSNGLFSPIYQVS